MAGALGHLLHLSKPQSPDFGMAYGISNACRLATYSQGMAGWQSVTNRAPCICGQPTATLESVPIWEGACWLATYSSSNGVGPPGGL